MDSLLILALINQVGEAGSPHLSSSFGYIAAPPLVNLTGFSVACVHHIVHLDENVSGEWILGNLTGFSLAYVHHIVYLDESVSKGWILEILTGFSVACVIVLFNLMKA